MKKDKKTVAVVGSRGVARCPALLARLAELAPAQLVSGGAAGVDTLAAAWARANGVPVRELRPDYAAHGPTAATHVRTMRRLPRSKPPGSPCWPRPPRATPPACCRPPSSLSAGHPCKSRP